VHTLPFLPAQVRNNVVLHTGGAGIGVYSARDSVIVHNTVVDAAQTMQVWNLGLECDRGLLARCHIVLLACRHVVLLACKNALLLLGLGTSSL
jgi:hypothetical protein